MVDRHHNVWSCSVFSINKQRNSIDFSLSKQDTLLIKGVAISAMLWHHLFGCGIPAEVSVYPDEIAFLLGRLGKVCVAMFLFASGYGLSIQFNQLNLNKLNTIWGEILRFWYNRFTKFYTNYWIIFLVFVPIGIFAFGRGLQVPYGENVNLYKCLVFDFFGIQGPNSYNITWWFNKLIIFLWIGYPFLYLLVMKLPILTLLVLLLWLGIQPIKLYLVQDFAFPFVLGIAVVLYRAKILTFLQRFDRKWLMALSVLFVIICSVQRQYNLIAIPYLNLSNTHMDGFFSISIVLFLILFVRNVRYLSNGLQFLGKHSMNIYLLHTFIFYYWFEHVVYALHYPILIFVILMCACLLISIGLEWLKKKLGFYRLMKILTK